MPKDKNTLGFGRPLPYYIDTKQAEGLTATKELQEYDSHLVVGWNNRDKTWCVFRHGHLVASGAVLDNRIIQSLKDGDLQRYKSIGDFERYIDTHNDKIREEMQNRMDAEIDEQANRAWIEKARENKDFFSMPGLPDQ